MHLSILPSQTTRQVRPLEPFFKEARLLDRLQHLNIVTIHSCDFIDGKVVIDMEYIRGTTLRQLLLDKKQWPMDRDKEQSQRDSESRSAIKNCRL